MMFIRTVTALILSLLAASSALSQVPASKEEARIIEATAILNEWQQMSDQGIPDRLLDRAQAIAIFPSVIKGAFIFGGRFGRGVVLVKDLNGRWSDPSFLTVAGGSWGLQIGAQSSDLILIFTTRKGIEGLSGGKVTIGGDISGAVGPVGRQLSGSTDLSFSAEVYSYSRAKGLFAGIALDGSSMSIDYSANAKYYGQSDLLASDIFAGKVKSEPATAQALIQAVGRLAHTTAQAGPSMKGNVLTPQPTQKNVEERGLESTSTTTFPISNQR